MSKSGERSDGRGVGAGVFFDHGGQLGLGGGEILGVEDGADVGGTASGGTSYVDAAFINVTQTPGANVGDGYVSLSLVPEPSTYALLLLSGAASLVALKRRKS